MASAPPPETCPPRPQLAELCRALRSLSQEKIRYMCVELGVPSATLSNIDASHPGQALRWITEYLDALLACDVSLTWERIVDVLSSSRLKEFTVAAEIRRTHCLSVVDGDRPTTPPLSVRCSTGVVNSGTRSDRSTGRPRTNRARNRTMPYPTPPTRSVDELLHLAHAIDVSELGERITYFKGEFRQVIINTNVHLSKKMSEDDFEVFKVDLTTLPMGTTQTFLQEEKEEIQEAQSVKKVFNILDPYWNHVDYELLEYIVHQYCDGGIKQLMENYKSELHIFEKATLVKHLTSAVADFYPLPPGYSTLTIALKKDGRECSLYDVREIKNRIAQIASLQSYAICTQDIHASAVVLTMGFPCAVSELIRRALGNQVGIVPNSLKFSDSSPPPSPSPTREQEKSIPGESGGGGKGKLPEAAEGGKWTGKGGATSRAVPAGGRVDGDQLQVVWGRSELLRRSEHALLLRYFADILPQLVFMEPQMLLDKVSELVEKTYQMRQGKKGKAVSGEKLKFYDYSVPDNKLPLSNLSRKIYVIIT